MRPVIMRELNEGDYFIRKYLNGDKVICQVTQDAGRHIWFTDGDKSDWMGPEEIVYVED